VNPSRRRRAVPAEPAELLRQRLAELQPPGRDSQLDFLQWSQRIPEPKSGRLDFERFPFQRELYESGADNRELVIKKATQVGVSAHSIRWAIYWAEQAGLTAVYVFPYQRQLADFSAGTGNSGAARSKRPRRTRGDRSRTRGSRGGRALQAAGRESPTWPMRCARRPLRSSARHSRLSNFRSSTTRPSVGSRSRPPSQRQSPRPSKSRKPPEAGLTGGTERGSGGGFEPATFKPRARRAT
jgi:hypothetical protein